MLCDSHHFRLLAVTARWATFHGIRKTDIIITPASSPSRDFGFLQREDGAHMKGYTQTHYWNKFRTHMTNPLSPADELIHFQSVSQQHSTPLHLVYWADFFSCPSLSRNNPGNFHLLNLHVQQILWLIFCIYDIHLPKMYLLSGYDVPGTILVTGAKDMNLCLFDLITSQWSHSNLIYSVI